VLSDRNWLEFLSVLDATFHDVASLQSPDPSEAAKTNCSENISQTQELFVRLAEQDGRSDRSASLALLELERRARLHKLSTGLLEILSISSGPEFASILQTKLRW
jgi:N-terminal acetyltransferase B complex non-catalytic subunit